MHTQTRARVQSPVVCPFDTARRGRGATQTFTAERGDLGERVVTVIALAADDARLADTLPRVHVAGPAVRAVRKAVTRQAGVLTREPVVILLQNQKGVMGLRLLSRRMAPGCAKVTAGLPGLSPPPSTHIPPGVASGLPTVPDGAGALSGKVPP